MTQASDPEARRLLLERSASETGEAWALRLFAELRAEGRRVVGGWPGTLTEARARVRAELRRERPTHAEVEHAAGTAYARARHVWLASAQGEDDEDDAEGPRFVPNATPEGPRSGP